MPATRVVCCVVSWCVYVMATAVSLAKTAEPIEMPLAREEKVGTAGVGPTWEPWEPCSLLDEGKYGRHLANTINILVLQRYNHKIILK